MNQPIPGWRVLNARGVIGKVLLAIAASGFLPVAGVAQTDRAAVDFPQRAVTMVMPGPPGGGPDLVARSLGELLAAKWGQAVVIENKPGATGMIGAETIARSEPSGHRLLFAFTALVQAPAVFAKVPYDLERDFAPVMQVANAPVFLAVRADSPIRNLADYIAAARNPAKPVSYGSFGAGSSYHIYGESLKRSKQLELLHVPYKGEALAMQDLLAGTLDSTFVSVGTGGPHVRAGKIRPIAVVGPTRSSVLPDLPTFSEAGAQGLEAVGWFGVLAPSGTPPAVVQKIARDLRAAVQDKATSTRLRELGFEPVSESDPTRFKAFIQAEAASWKKLIADTGVKPE
ncbi:MAG: tripartite tricarboxylate transporter substrate binding protein [Burkholderiales bacterium]|nr:tripartite tricarboxylate transporter substrate binding protein [Burkholderiales bacterium]